MDNVQIFLLLFKKESFLITGESYIAEKYLAWQVE